MRLPPAFFLGVLPYHSSLAASIALTTIYGILSIVGYGYFAVWRFSPYLSAALGAGGKFTGFLLRCIFLSNSDINVYAAASVFLTAGMSACTSAQAGVLAEWFKNAAAAHQLGLHRRYPHLLPAACRLISLPVIIFGPGIGVPAAILMYGVRTPDSVQQGGRLRKWSAWGTLACLAVLTLLALLALVLAIAHRRSTGGGKTPVFLVASALLSVLLIEVSGAARVHSIYDKSITLNDSLWYPLIVLPELLQSSLSSWPTLLHRTALAESYNGWRTATWPWVRRAFPQDKEGGSSTAAEAGAVRAEAKGAALGIAASCTNASVSTSLGKCAAPDGSECDCKAPPL